MKRLGSVVLVLLLSLGFLGLTACNTVQANATGLQIAGQAAGYFSCQQLKDPAATTLLRRELVTGALPLLNATTPVEAAAAETAIFTPLAARLGPQYRVWLLPAMTLLQGLYTPATPDTVLTSTDLIYLKAFTTGVVQGIDMYNAGLPATQPMLLKAKRMPPYFFHWTPKPATPLLVAPPVPAKK